MKHQNILTNNHYKRVICIYCDLQMSVVKAQNLSNMYEVILNNTVIVF